jgi:hypothetical protein
MTTAQDGSKVVSLTHQPHLPPGNILGTHFCYRHMFIFTEVLAVLLISLREYASLLSHIRPRVLPSTSLPILYSLTLTV